MKKSSDTIEKNETIINVIDQLDSSTQSEHYNSLFRKWRKDKKNQYAFRFEMNRKESVFVDGRGFISSSAAAAERETLSRIMNVIGIAMLFWIVIESLFSKGLVFLLSLTGFDVHTTIYDSALYGGTTEIVSALIIITIIKLAVPIVYMRKRFAMPVDVEFMRTMNDPRGLISAIAMTLIICTVMSIPSAFSNDAKEVYSFFRSVDADVSLWTQTDFMTYVLFDVVVVSVFTEMMLHGAVFGALRQFGDAFAICVTALVAGLLTQDFREMLVIMLISAAAGWGMLASGTIFTAFSVHVIYRMYMLALAVIEVDTSIKMVLYRSVFMVSAFVIGTLVLLIQYLARRKPLISSKLAVYHSDVSLSKRLLFIFRTFPFFAVAIICLLNAIMRVVK